MRYLVLLSLLLLSPAIDKAERTGTDGTVYICTGPKSKRYHRTSGCKGLNSCSESIKSVSLEYAKRIGRTQCKICYK